jgi:tRNA nucleotidyltransferase/poly(A) polymerase
MASSVSDHLNSSLWPAAAATAEQGLEGLELPPQLAGWIDRLPADLLEAIDIIENQGKGCCWIVGGSVRDSLCGLQPWEIDMASTLHPDRLLELFPRALDTGSQYGTVTIRHGGVSVE